MEKDAKKMAVEAYGRFSAEYMSALDKEAAKDWAVVKAYIDAEADRVAQSNPPVVDRTAVALVNDADSVFRMMSGSSGGRGTPLDNDIWDTVYRFREKTCTAEINEACEKYGDDDVLAAYLDSIEAK